MPSPIDLMKQQPGGLTLGLSVALMTGAMWVYHYYVDFLIIEAAFLTPVSIAFHLAPVPLGAAIFVRYLRNQDIFRVMIYGNIGTFLFMGLSAILVGPSITPLLFIGVGIFVGVGSTAFMYLVPETLPGVEIRGLLYSLAHIGIAGVTIAMVVIATSFSVLFSFANAELVGALTFYLTIAIILAIAKPRIVKDRVEPNPELTELPIRQVATDSNLLPAYVGSMFQGLFFTTTYYSVQNFLDERLGFSLPRGNVVIEIFLVAILISVPMGYILQRKGRKIVVLGGAYVQGLSLILVAILPAQFITQDVVLWGIIPLFSIGVYAGVFMPFLLFVEVGPEFGRKVYQGVSFGLFGVGMTAGVWLSSAITPMISSSPLFLPVVMLFLYFTFTLLVIQLKEPLPSKSEREWRKKLFELLVINEGGLPLYQHRFGEGRTQVDSTLTSGALSGIDGIMSEITNDKERLKILKKEKFCIILEHSGNITFALFAEEELPILRKKLQLFRAEFMAFFDELIKQWSGSAIVFSPADRIVQKVFGYGILEE